ncbi:hypothetical protein [Saccharibacter floricola]|uniref:hypothetical protein n=1 Tax=Saccharibacter floricola TaxID=231053 RepID=UPI0003731531|nr:hypothetical protein [Saccharibacter floricola]
MAHFKMTKGWIGAPLKEVLHRAGLAIRRIVQLAVATIGLAGLAGCGTPQIKGLCPAYVHYSKQDDQTILTELRTTEAAGQSMPTIYRYLRDYGKQRAALRVICAGNSR